MEPHILRLLGVMVTLATAGGIGFLLVAVGVALARRIEGRKSAADEEIAFLRDQVEDIVSLKERIAELESRVDFAERLLAAPATTPDGGTPLDRG